MGDAPVDYDEFGLLHENAAEWGLPFEALPPLRRGSVEVAPGRRVSAIVWGDTAPQLAFLHGGGQNAHTWDTVALALDRPLVALDLPGHGHSDPGPNGPFDVGSHAADTEAAVRALAPTPLVLVGMSLGGLTAIALAARAPDLVRTLVLVDVTPSVDQQAAAPIRQFLDGPESFATFEEILERTMRFNPTRTESSLRRGILHNAVRRDDGRWVWRHQRVRPKFDTAPPDFTALWESLEAVTAPVVLVRGLEPGSVVDDAAVAELLRRKPSARIMPVAGAGHSVQGDQPLALAQVIAELV